MVRYFMIRLIYFTSQRRVKIKPESDVKYCELFHGHVPKNIIVKISRVEYIYIYIYIYIIHIYMYVYYAYLHFPGVFPQH